jgi:hypothetical protein
MKVVDNLNQRIKKFTFIDMKLIGFSGVLIGIIIAKLLPNAVASIPYWLFIVLAVACLIRPWYIFLFKKE